LSIKKINKARKVLGCPEVAKKHHKKQNKKADKKVVKPAQKPAKKVKPAE